MDQYLGEIRMVGFNFAPVGWALCNGQLLAVNSNAALFSLLGTYYGGNGSTTFGLPNLQSRVPIHMGQGTGLSPYVIGQASGTETIALTTQQMPIHNHTLAVNGTAQPTSNPNPAGNFLVNTAVSGRPPVGLPVNLYGATSDGSTMAPGAITPSGGNQPHANIQPYLCINFIIALQGIFPSRG